jgi:hypothetical protein
MKMDDLQQLGEMAAKLRDTARKLSPGLKQIELLQDIDRFRAHQNPSVGDEGKEK